MPDTLLLLSGFSFFFYLTISIVAWMEEGSMIRPWKHAKENLGNPLLIRWKAEYPPL